MAARQSSLRLSGRLSYGTVSEHGARFMSERPSVHQYRVMGLALSLLAMEMRAS